MATSKIRGILTQLKTVLQGINGAGGYTYDLSGDDQVYIGEGLTPPRYPAAAVYLLSVQGAHGAQLGRYTRTASIQIQAWVAAQSSDPGERAMCAADLLDDIMAAVEADRKLNGNVKDLIFVQSGTLNGDEMGVPGCGIAIANLETYFTVNSGAGT
jgi:hypothetical protein